MMEADSLVQGHRVLTLPEKTWNLSFFICFSRPGKSLEFAQKMGKKPGILTEYLEKREICKFKVSKFTLQDVI